MGVPNNLRYTDEHVWVKVEGDHARVGVTDFAQSELGDIVFIELPEKGTFIEADEPFGSVESVKTVSELYAPVSGKVLEVNKELDDRPELVNESPFDKAWIIVVEPTEMSEVEKLMSAEEYKKIVSEDE
ncbi:glycine cleavage system protein GcvH [Pueribacillus sp. YX66]|uniref:glycine cleavage system protein GcvH n=1 Tax=Pueribacillus sp. YX66 TaxID=3229242 RepID=UPI00358D188B